MTSSKARAKDAREWWEVFYVRLREGFVEHLRYFSGNGNALSVFLWALLVRDHETGEFVPDRPTISDYTGLSDAQVRRALTYLRHGRRCTCEKCEGLNVFDRSIRPSYFEEVRPAFRGSPPILRIRKDDSRFLAAAKKARRHKGAGQLELSFEPDPALAEIVGRIGDNLGTTRGQFEKVRGKVRAQRAASGRNSLQGKDESTS